MSAELGPDSPKLDARDAPHGLGSLVSVEMGELDLSQLLFA